MGNSALKIDHISKGFPGVQALNDVSFEINQGEIHALVGENGAGKSTLMNIIMGVFPPDKGGIYLNNDLINPKSPHDAQMLGIGIVPQELNLVPFISVAENIFLGSTSKKGAFSRVGWQNLYVKAKEYIDLLRIGVDPKEITQRLSPAQQQLVQIARILALNCNVFIMDEPTACLTSEEVKNLFTILRNLRQQGKTVIYICHKMDEVFEISDRITVMRDGRHVVTKDTTATNHDEVIKFMVGRDLNLEERPPKVNSFGEKILEVRNFSRKHKTKNTKNVDFYVRQGEIIGFAGLVGAGRTELVNAIFGVDGLGEGEILFEGTEVKIKSPKDAIKLGIGLIPEERRSQGILPSLSVKINITLPIIEQLSTMLGFIRKKETSIAKEHSELLNVKTPSIQQKIAFLSGGNQQKAIIARWVARQCKLLIFDEPTRGIDVGAKREIYNLIRDLARKGIAVIVVSSEFQELFSLTDRIYVMKEGMIINEFQTEEASQERIMACILDRES
ncbi:MAG: sugar ABC transporter ATP-binding protein [Bacillota bacterium]